MLIQPPLLLDDLPTEIKDLIFDHVIHDSSPDELKRFRQSNRYFRDRADIYLFRTLHVSASTSSLDRLRHVAESDRLSVQVKELVFHRGTFSGHKMVRSGQHGLTARDFDDFETYIVKSTRNHAPSGMLRISGCYQHFVEELKAETSFNRDLTWRSTLKKHTSRFPKLDKLTVLPSDHDLESDYLRQRCGTTHQSWTPNYFAPYEIFEACGPQFRPRSLDLSSVNGEDFATIMLFIRGGKSAIQKRFAGLTHLLITFSETVSSLTIDDVYDVLFPACKNLQSLTLGFRSFYSTKLLKDPDCFPQTLIKCFLQQDYPKLRHLHLIYPMMTEHDFTDFLHRHSQILATITLNRWSMPVTTSSNPTGSVLRALWSIGTIPFKNLRSVDLQGEFSNRANGDGWQAKLDSPGIPPELNLRARLEEYMTLGIEKCPWPIPTLTRDLLTKAETVGDLRELDDGVGEKLVAADYRGGTFEHWLWVEDVGSSGQENPTVFD